MEKSICAQDYKTLLKLLRETREAAGLTQIDLAKKIGENQSFVSKCERGERRIDIIEWIKFCKAIGIKPEDFLEKLEKSLAED